MYPCTEIQCALHVAQLSIVHVPTLSSDTCTCVRACACSTDLDLGVRYFQTTFRNDYGQKTQPHATFAGGQGTASDMAKDSLDELMAGTGTLSARHCEKSHHPVVPHGATVEEVNKGTVEDSGAGFGYQQSVSFNPIPFPTRVSAVLQVEHVSVLVFSFVAGAHRACAGLVAATSGALPSSLSFFHIGTLFFSWMQLDFARMFMYIHEWVHALTCKIINSMHILHNVDTWCGCTYARIHDLARINMQTERNTLTHAHTKKHAFTAGS
jgi:hypothetical protein